MSVGWSSSEKKVARKAFDSALHAELADVMARFKNMAASAREPADMWAIEDFLTEARRTIDRKYDFRYSRLDIVFGQLLREGRISMDNLQGLAEDKLSWIKRLASGGE